MKRINLFGTSAATFFSSMCMPFLCMPFLCMPFLCMPGAVLADFKLPAPSPRSTVTQQVGVTDVTVSYSAPGVKGRKVFGELVPYGEVWRTGSNACTKFETEDPIKVAGKSLEAGDYCVFSIPNKDKWEVIFNSDDRQFAAVDYDKTKDALRVSVKPETAPFRERMAFSFSDVTENSATLRLEWDKTAVVLPIETETDKLALQKIQELKDGSSWEYLMAARYLKDQKQNTTLALEYIEKSIAKEKMWFNTYVKGDILAAKGEHESAAKLAAEAQKLSDGGVLYKVFEPRILKASKEWSDKANQEG